MDIEENFYIYVDNLLTQFLTCENVVNSKKGRK